MSTMYCAEPSPLHGSTQEMPVIWAGAGLSPLKDGGRLPPVRSAQWIIWVTVVPVSGMALLGAAHMLSYSVTGTHVPQVIRPSAVWAESTSWRASSTVMLTCDGGAPPSPAPVGVSVPLMSNWMPPNMERSDVDVR